MFRYDSASVATAAFATSAALFLLTGCAQLTNLAEKRHEEHFDTYAEASTGWVGVDIPAWIPADSVDIRSVASTDETVAVIRATSPSALPDDCVTVNRTGIPVLDADWSVEKWPDEVALCGDYEVMAVEDGWLGWFNAATTGQTPEA
ncbi:MAG TPA: hypothetical protein VIL55_13430 [Naasia sp.]